MTVSELFEGILKPNKKTAFTQLCREAFKVIRAYRGCQAINLTYNIDNENNWVHTETWDSKERYEKYVAFRLKDGTVKAINALCEKPPSIKI